MRSSILRIFIRRKTMLSRLVPPWAMTRVVCRKMNFYRTTLGLVCFLALRLTQLTENIKSFKSNKFIVKKKKIVHVIIMKTKNKIKEIRELFIH